VISTLLLRKPVDVPDIARLILNSYQEHRVFALKGDLGAGKTTLIKGLCEVLGVSEGTSSPSFSIVNEYRTEQGERVYHFDLYRLRAAEELEGIGFVEYVDSGAYCFIEWPELALDLLPKDAVVIELNTSANGTRTLRIGPIP